MSLALIVRQEIAGYFFIAPGILNSACAFKICRAILELNSRGMVICQGQLNRV
jgi:hypothetical protein